MVSADSPWKPRQGRSVHKNPNTQSFTTIMIANVPWEYSQAELLGELDEIEEFHHWNFFYLPWTKHRNMNCGYAFANFPTPEISRDFISATYGRVFKLHGTGRAAKALFADVQGFVANLVHFHGRAVALKSHPHGPLISWRGHRVLLGEAAMWPEIQSLLTRALAHGEGTSAPGATATITGAPQRIDRRVAMQHPKYEPAELHIVPGGGASASLTTEASETGLPAAPLWKAQQLEREAHIWSSLAPSERSVPCPNFVRPLRSGTGNDDAGRRNLPDGATKCPISDAWTVKPRQNYGPTLPSGNDSFFQNNAWPPELAGPMIIPCFDEGLIL